MDGCRRPIPRTDAPSGKTPGEGKADKSAEAQTRPVPDTGKKLSPGQESGHADVNAKQRAGDPRALTLPFL